jgi:hypothetical protein
MDTPGYESLPQPILEMASDTMKPLPGGSKTIYDRIHWAVLYHSYVGIIRSTRRDHFRIPDDI